MQCRLPEHLKYFLCLEDDIYQMSRWIEITKDNYDCYSVELARLLMTATAEVDVLAKDICNEIDPNKKASTINVYQKLLVSAYPKIIKAKVTMPRYDVELYPWSCWKEENKSPFWWQANNKVKHHRSTHFYRATLENVLNAASGLLLLILLYHGPKMRSFMPSPKLFQVHTYGYNDGSNCLVYAKNLG